MGGDARGLVDDDYVIVVVHDPQIGDHDGDDARLRLGDPGDLEPAAGGKAVGLGEGLAVELHSAGLGDLGGERAREAEELSYCRVDPLAGEPVRYEEAAGFHIRPRRG